MSVPRSLWVTNDFPPRAGGIEAFVGELAGRLPGVRVLTAHATGDSVHDASLAYRVDRVGRRPLLPTPALLRRVRAAATAHQAEIVVFGASWPLGELGSGAALPTFALTHGHEAGMARVGLGPLVRRVARRVDGIGVISEFTRSALSSWVDGHTTVHRLSPGVDTGRFRPDVDGAKIRRRYGIGDDQPLTVCVSRLVARKGQDVLVEAWPQVQSRIRGAHLLLAGTGRLGARLQARIRALGLERSVTLVGGIGPQDLPAVHGAADVFAMPCRTRLRGLDVEGLGIVFLEAQASGTPVVVGRSGGAPETVVDGETGLVVEGTSPEAVAHAVASLLADPRRREEMGAAGRASVQQTSAWPVVAERCAAILTTICRPRQP